MDNSQQRHDRRVGQKKTGSHRRRIVRILACFVVFCTTYALILPALTMERQAYCDQAEHTHSSSCYVKELVCPLEESGGTAGHTHTDACYKTERVLVCGQEEQAADEGHAHTDACYDEQGTLICGQEERPAAAGHTHTDACYEEQKTLVCGQKESAAKEGHTHTDACYKTVLKCGKEEHKHTLACYSNPNADLETRAQWEKTVPDKDKLTGIWADDLLTVAESQLSYEESVRNYEVVGESTKGYTRYGAWYGIPYGDWCAMYVSFCLYYADIPKEEMPYEASCAGWVEILKKKDMYLEAKDGRPRPGDLIFFERNHDKYRDADHVGIVIKVDEKKGIIDTIEGNTSNKVAYRHYDWDDEQILGYGLLPENPNPPKDEETVKEDKSEDAAAEETAAEEASPIVREFTGSTASVNVRVEAPSEAFPEDTTMELEEVSADDVMDAVTGAVEGEVVRVDAVDITFRHDGKEIEPAVPIRVSMVPVKSVQKGEPAVVHLPDKGKAEQVDSVSLQEGSSGLQFEADAFSVYALVYTVDFRYEVDGEVYDLSFPGGGFASFTDVIRALGVVKDDEDTASDEVALFVADVEKVVFSDSSLLSASKVNEDTTVADIKDALVLTCEYSADLTEEQIEAINATEVRAGDWALISLRPFDTEESLTVTMRNGEEFTITVTDAHEIPDSSSSTIDANKSYLICYQVGNQYYLLKNDGTVDSTHNPNNFENLNSTYCWSFNYVFEEKHLEDSLTYVYYLIRPIDHKQKTLALNEDGNELVQQSNNNVAVVPAEGGGFHLIGYNNVKLNFANGTFFADELPAGNDGIIVHIYEMDALPTYSYTVRSSDEEKGTVSVQGGVQRTDTDGTHYYEADSNNDKKNAGTITATPVDHKNPPGAWWTPNKWEFDHWEQDGVPLDRDQYPATIDANTLPIPFNGSNLVAYFKQNDDYTVPDSEKEPSSFEDMTNWLDELKDKPVPLDLNATDKTAEVYDYENRIYRVDITTKPNFRTFKGNVDMAFCMDVSNSMYFPSKLVEDRELPIYRINENWWNKQWLDQSSSWSNPLYYLIADQADTATVFKIYYQDGNWKAQDASRETESDKSFIIGQPFETNWTKNETDKTHPFNAGDNDDSRYMIYNAGDSGRNRFFYLNQSFTGALSDLTEIRDLLKVAGDDSPDVNFAYNTFNKDLGSQRHDFQSVYKMGSIDLSNSHGGGTRPDQAFNDAMNFNWSGDDRYVILITDGAPQGIRTGESNQTTQEQIYTWVREAAQNLKDEKGVKFITIGLSLDKVPQGKKILYDLADKDSEGNKMFYMAESASDLPNILREVIDTIMDDAIVYADVTDTVGEAFYPVDKTTGLQLQPGDMVDIEGRKVTDPAQAAGTLQADGITFKWNHQALDPATGWHGTVYVKAKEDLIGGNAVKTNGDAGIVATGYKMGDKEYSFEESPLDPDKLQSISVDLETPRTNVNELAFPNATTEWTVYLGTEVDPEKQIRQMYEEAVVKGVVNSDAQPDDPDYVHYPIVPNSIEDDRIAGEHGTAYTFSLSGEILEAIKADPALSALYVTNDELNWDKFLEDIQRPDGVTVPYHKYGVEGEDSNIQITLTKEIIGNEKDINESPHETTEVNGTDGTPVEKYVLTVQFNPDYDHVLPLGQGGHGHIDYHTGTYGTMYQGHAAGRETSTNTHIINVYVKGLQIFKTDPDGETRLKNAEFTLYRTARTGDDQSKVTTITVNGEEKQVYPAATLVTDNNGVAKVEAVEQLNDNEEYYLVETKAPAGYNLLTVPIPVTLQINDTYTLADGSQGDPPATGVYNWEQTATLRLGNVNGVIRTDENNTEIQEPVADSENGLVYYRIDNSPGYVLPHTGGPGVTIFALTGLLLITASGFLILRRKRKVGT